MELSDYIRILRAHWIVILIATILGAGAAFGWSATQPRVYSADTTALKVTDAAVLAASADGVIIVVSSGKTTFDMLQRATKALAG